MFKFFAVIVAAVFALAVSATPIDLERRTSAPSGFNITSIGVNGSGCPAGTVYYVLSEDRTAVTVTFSNFYAEAGPGIGISSNRKACQLTLGIRVPGGFTFGIGSVDYRGYYQLDSGVWARQRSIYYFQGELNQATASSTINGPVNGKDYTYRDEFDLATTVKAPCGASTILNINESLQVNNGGNTGGTGYIATDSIDAKLTQVFNFNWYTC